MYRFYIISYTLISLALSQYNISGFIYDSETGESLPGANIFLENSMYGTTSDLDGYFVILNVSKGQYNFNVKYLGYENFSKILVIDKNLQLKK